jgi:peptide/nickel transport system ATP-binding protein
VRAVPGSLAIANDPVLLIADEPTTALDVTVRAGILDLLRDLRAPARHGGAADHPQHGRGRRHRRPRVVIYDGEVVERGEVVPLFADPRHEDTRELVAAVPTAAADRREPVRTVAEEVAVVRDLSVLYRGRFRTGGVWPSTVSPSTSDAARWSDSSASPGRESPLWPVRSPDGCR